MNFPPRRRATTGVVLVALLLLAGCSGSSEKDAEKIREAILDNAPGVEDAMVRYRTDIFVNDLDIRLSMPTTYDADNEALAAAIDATLEQAWSVSPSEPSNISIEVTLAPFTEGERVADSGSIRLEGRAIDENLGLEKDANRYTLTLPTRELAERYGPRDGS